MITPHFGRHPIGAYHVEITYWHRNGEAWTKCLPKPYRTQAGAQRAADTMGFICKPDGVTIVEELAARVVLDGTP
jgi:hypothetical protein